MARRNDKNGDASCLDILESISDGVFTVDAAWKVTSFNRAAEAITGIDRSEALGRPCSEVFRSSMCEKDCALRRTLANGKPVINQPCHIIDAEGRGVPISVSTAVLRDQGGLVCGGAETFRDLSEIEELRQALEGRHRVGEIVSDSPAMRDAVELAKAVAASASTVLVQGETGTGKELLARAIHSAGPRAARPFVAVNCGALPDSLLESELFGYKRGAFTGADRDKPGRFALAKDGTIFLDEIGEVSPSMQVRLLRVLQERQFEPLGGNGPEPVAARVVAATNRDLAALVKQGKFREDLFYRVNVVRIDLPPLRRRKVDIPALAERFVAKFNRLQRKEVEGFSSEALAALMSHDWPGNIRELENAVERAFALCPGGRIELRHLPGEITGASPMGDSPGGYRQTRRAAETRGILAAVERHHGNRAAAARELGVDKTTFYRAVKRLGLDLPPPRVAKTPR